MMERLLARGAAIAAREADVMAALIEQAARDELPSDVGVELVDGGVVIFGRGLLQRFLFDGRLRGLAMLAKGLRR